VRPWYLALLTLLTGAILATALALWGTAAYAGLTRPRPIDSNQAGTPVPQPTISIVTPVAVTVVSSESIVTPLEGQAQAQTGPLADGPAAESSSPFTGVRGGLIGAGIALAIVVAATVAVRATRAAVRQRHR
jgi:hypothetical protein